MYAVEWTVQLGGAPEKVLEEQCEAGDLHQEEMYGVEAHTVGQCPQRGLIQTEK